MLEWPSSGTDTIVLSFTTLQQMHSNEYRNIIFVMYNETNIL